MVQETGNQFGILLFLPIYHQGAPLNTQEERHNQIESYIETIHIRDHSEAEFSHSICPECAKELYPGIYENEEDTI